MFYYISGTLEHLDASFCAIDCGGVGYGLTVSSLTASALSQNIGKKTKLYTYLAVREDGIELFGFLSLEERECFNKLITVSGVGPKAAMSILSILSPDALALAIASNDVKAISKANGVGKKTAERLILELRDKVSSTMMEGGAPTLKSSATPAYSPVISEAAEALMSLGYDKNTVNNALKDADPKATDVGELIRLALKKLSR